jgi:hypothetical protein
MTKLRTLLLGLAVCAISATAGVAGMVAANDQPGTAGSNQPEHGPPPAGSDLLVTGTQILASLAFIADPTIDCGGPCLAGSPSQVRQAILERCEKEGIAHFAQSNPNRAPGDPLVALDRVIAEACVAMADASVDEAGEVAKRAAEQLPPLNAALTQARQATR